MDIPAEIEALRLDLQRLGQVMETIGESNLSGHGGAADALELATVIAHTVALQSTVLQKTLAALSALQDLVADRS